MKKKLLAVAVSALVALPVVSLADVKIYGRAHVSLDMLDDGADYNELNVSSNSSRLGFKGESKQGDYTAFVQIEQEINFAQGGGAAWAGRDTFVGVKGGFGSVRVGQFDSPFKAARGPANLFGDQLGDMRNLTRVGASGNFDERPQNTIHYQTKNFDGLQFNVAYSAHNAANHQQDTKEEVISLSATYKAGPIDAALAYEAWGEDRTERDAIRLAAAYKVADNLKLVGFFQTSSVEATDAEADVFGLGGEFSLSSATALKAMYMVRQPDADDADSSLIAVGVEHKIDKQLRVYANYAMLANDAASPNLQPWNQARTTNTVGNSVDETASGLSLGLRYDF